MTKQQLANKIWDAANKMRGSISAAKYKDYILGFIFYKFLSDKQVKFLKKIGAEDDELPEYTESPENQNIIEMSRENIGYFIGYENLFSTWLANDTDFNIKNVKDALTAFSRNISKTHENVYKGIFNTLDTGLSDLGDGAMQQTKAAKELLRLIKDIPTDSNDGYDVLGYIYEYLLKKFAIKSGKAGEFYTPIACANLMQRILLFRLKDEKEIKIYDPCSGSGSLLLHVGQYFEEYNDNKDCVKYFAQELNKATYNLTRMNLIMRGIDPGNICVRCGDSLDRDWPIFSDSDPEHTYTPLIDLSAVSMNPPYSQDWNPEAHTTDPRFANYGLAPSSKADLAFVLHGFYHLKNGGVQTVVLPHGVLFRGGSEETIRKNLLENNNVDAIIGMPADIFMGTPIPTIIAVLRKGREEKDVLIIDASKGFIKADKKNTLRERDVKKIFDTYVERKDIPGYSRKVSLEEIRSNDYNLNIPRYIDSSEKAESLDIYASMYGGIPNTEIDETIGDELKLFPSLKGELFKASDIPYTELKTDDIKGMVLNNSDVKQFVEDYKIRFKSFSSFLEENLINKIKNKEKISKIESAISDELFKRLDDIPIIDKYEVYQVFADLWKTISSDLETINTSGLESINEVEPNMVEKTVSKELVEVQDGWKGRILPFELVQKELMGDNLKEIEELKAKIESINADYMEKICEIPEEDRDSLVLKGDEPKYAFNEDGVPDTKVIKKLLKPYTGKKAKKIESGSPIEKLNEIGALIDREKECKSEVQKKLADLEEETRDVLAKMSFDVQKDMLRKKWIEPLLEEIGSMPGKVIAGLLDKIEKLNKKYAVSLLDTESEIEKAETELVSTLKGLQGSDYDIKGLEAFKTLLGGN